MRRQDLLLSAVVAFAAAAPAAPALLAPHLALGNFGDLYAYHHPLRGLAAARLQEGALPFWNAYAFSGLPLLANPQSALFYPLSVLFFFLPVGYAFTLHAALHLALAALGMQLWLRRAGLKGLYAAGLAAAYALCPFLVLRIPQGIPTHLAGLAWVPWCWLALGARRPWLLAGVWALQGLSGHPQFAALNAAAMGLHALSDGARLKTFALGAAGAAALALVQALPTLQFMAVSTRVGWPPEFANAYPLPLSALATLLCPAAAGTPFDGGFAGPPSVFFETCGLYLGLVPLALAVFGVASSPRDSARSAALPGPRWGWGLAGLGLFFALGPLNPVLAWAGSLPGLSLSRVSARFGFWIVWGLFIAAAGGALALQRRSNGRLLPAAALALILADLGFWAARWTYAQDPAGYLDPNPQFAAALGGRPMRFATDPDHPNADKAMLYRAMNVNGYDAFYLRSYAEYASRAEGVPAADPSRTYLQSLESEGLRRLGVAYLLTDKQRPGPFLPVWGGGAKLYSSEGAYPLAWLRGSGRPQGPGGGTSSPYGSVGERREPRLKVFVRSPERWLVSGAWPGGRRDLVLSVPSYPGWRAWLDGREVELALEDGLLQRVWAERPAGAFRLHLRFRPTAWAALCLWGCAAWGAWLVRGARGAAREATA